MNKFLFVLSTLIGGFFIQIIASRYLTIFEATPQILLLFVVTMGFLYGPVMGEAMGFAWGMMADSIGVEVFGLNALVFTIAGYLAGKLRRRVASERAAGQLVIAVVSTLYYWLFVPFLCSIFDESRGNVPILTVLLEALLNVIFVSGVFWLLDRWIDAWRLEREHM